MSHLLDDDDDDLNGHPAHREVTLSVSAVLGIFFALALSWALFFGFGYNMGNKSHQAVQTAAAAPDGSTGNVNFNSFKPAPGSPAFQGSSASNSPTVNTVPVAAGSGPVTTIAPPAATPKPTAQKDEENGPAPVHLPPAAVVHTGQAPPPAPTPAPANTPGSFVVQIAAVSHQEDAELLVGALRGKGYSVAARPEADKLVHIQIGPFTTRQAADAMRQRLLSDGYNAIVK